MSNLYDQNWEKQEVDDLTPQIIDSQKVLHVIKLCSISHINIWDFSTSLYMYIVHFGVIFASFGLLTNAWTFKT